MYSSACVWSRLSLILKAKANVAMMSADMRQPQTLPHPAQAVRERKAVIREGEHFQARVPFAPLDARPPGAEADDPRCGVLGPGPTELLASVMGPERAAADELPMDARMDPDARARAAPCLSCRAFRRSGQAGERHALGTARAPATP